ncbi:MAG TPA: phospholipase D-like domain-containing protein, partial [Candidatus Methylomirabilis sp.]|nr:phospholipase D-like domain-containing protein [Candidatus Methylomirabilis sp.]
VVDHDVAFTGGANIGDEYLGESHRGPWRDTSMELRGPCVREFASLFEDAWSHTTGEPRNAALPEPRGFADGETVNVIPSGPDTDWKAIHLHYLSLIHASTRSLRIQMPYFIPDESLMMALQLAALRNVDVDIMLPRHPDWPYLRWVAHTYLDDLLRAGVRVHEYRVGFLHPKVIIADEAVASIGTCNLDIRSLRLDFEVNILVSAPATIRHLNEDFDRDLEMCDEIDYAQFIMRPLRARVKESLARLISPLL